MKTIFTKIWDWIKRHKIISAIVAIVVVLIVISIVRKANTPASVVTDTVVRRELKRTVLATGDVTSTTNLNLSFASSGTVSSVKVKVGDVVKQGQILATLSNESQVGAVTQAQGAVASAQAALDKINEGATSQDVAISQVALKNAQINLQTVTNQQNQLVANAYSALLNAGLTVETFGSSTTPALTPLLSGTYVGTQEGQYFINTHGGSGAYFSFSGLENGSGTTDKTTSVPLGTYGLNLTFPVGFTNQLDVKWVINIPNTKSGAYLSALNAYNAALETQKNALASAQAGIDAAQADLALKQAAARPSDVAAAQANVLSAQGQLQSAQAAYDNTIIRAPADGTITSVDIKIGELATAQKEVLILQNVSDLYLEANINEADIARVVLNQPVAVTFDALGPNQTFTAKVSEIDPAGTVISGVVNYKIEAQLQGDTSQIKPGMTANMTIVTDDKPNVLVVPTRAILDGANGKVVRVITNTKKNTYVQDPVTVGLEGDDGTEITSGLTEGQTIVVLDNSTNK
jgi:HlyD family secretion protein